MPSSHSSGSFPSWRLVGAVWLFALLLAHILLSGCAPEQKTYTGWVDHTSPYPTTILELIDGTADSGLDLGAAIASEWDATGVHIVRTINPDGSGSMTIDAETFGTSRAEMQRALAEELLAANEQIRSLWEGVAASIEQIVKLYAPFPDVNLGDSDGE